MCTPLQALLGKAWALEAMHEQRSAWELLSEASIRLPWAVPLQIELARLTLAQQDWDALAEVVARLQQVDSSNVMALAYHGEMVILVLVCDPSCCVVATARKPALRLAVDVQPASRVIKSMVNNTAQADTAPAAALAGSGTT